MGKRLMILLAALIVAGCATSGPTIPVVQRQLLSIPVIDVADTSAAYVAVRLLDNSFNPLGFLGGGSHFWLVLQNQITGEIDKIQFSTKGDLGVYKLDAGTYKVREVDSVNWAPQDTPNGYANPETQIVHAILPSTLDETFAVAAGEIMYLGKLVTDIQMFSTSIVHQSSFDSDKASMLQDNSKLAGFAIKSYTATLESSSFAG